MKLLVNCCISYACERGCRARTGSEAVKEASPPSGVNNPPVHGEYPYVS